jgi:hypothetical protein
MQREMFGYMWATIAAGFASCAAFNPQQIACKTDEVIAIYKTRAEGEEKAEQERERVEHEERIKAREAAGV